MSVYKHGASQAVHPHFQMLILLQRFKQLNKLQLFDSYLYGLEAILYPVSHIKVDRESDDLVDERTIENDQVKFCVFSR
jgi:hypothetical protein